MVKLIAKSLDVIFCCKTNACMILLAEHDSQGFPPRVKTRAFGISKRFASFVSFYDFRVALNMCCAQHECLVVKLIARFLDLILVLQNEHLVLLAEHDSLGFLPRVKTRTFCILTCFARCRPSVLYL